MGKKSKKKKSNPNRQNIQPKSIEQRLPAETKNTPKEKPFHAKKILKNIWVTIGVISTIGGLIAFVFFPKQFKELFKTKKEEFRDERYLRGILIPEEVLMSDNNEISISYGSLGQAYSVNRLRNGVTLEQELIKCNNKPPFDLKLKLINNRLYFSTIFKYIENNEVVGIIKDGKWALVKDNMLDYYESDTSITVIDNSANLIFGMKYTSGNDLSIEGYFFDDCIFVVNDGLMMFPPNQKDSARKYIRKMDASELLK